MTTESENPKNPLSEYTNEELLDEISLRCASMVWAGCVLDDNSSSTTTTYIYGNRATCYGLTAFLKDVIHEKMLDESHGDDLLGAGDG